MKHYTQVLIHKPFKEFCIYKLECRERAEEVGFPSSTITLLNQRGNRMKEKLSVKTFMPAGHTTSRTLEGAILDSKATSKRVFITNDDVTLNINGIQLEIDFFRKGVW